MSQIPSKTEEQHAAEAEVESFRRDRGPFVVAAETTRMPMVFTDAKSVNNPIVFANDSFLALFRYQREEVVGQDFVFLLARAADPGVLTKIAVDLKSSNATASDNCYRRKDGSEFWAATFINPVRDECDVVIQNFASFIDLTRHKEEQAHSKMLIAELNHRVKNTLATVQSIVRQSLRKAANPEVVCESIESRLFALARSHDLLTREQWKGVGLFDLVNEVLEPFGRKDGGGGHSAITGENIRLPPKAALVLSIVLHELATNALKHGAFSTDTGSIQVAWTTEPNPQGDRLVLHWKEKDGPPVTAPSRKGFGSQVIERGLPYELDGAAHLDYRPDGLVCTIDVRVPQAVRDG